MSTIKNGGGCGSPRLRHFQYHRAISCQHYKEGVRSVAEVRDTTGRIDPGPPSEPESPREPPAGRAVTGGNVASPAGHASVRCEPTRMYMFLLYTDGGLRTVSFFTQRTQRKQWRVQWIACVCWLRCCVRIRQEALRARRETQSTRARMVGICIFFNIQETAARCRWFKQIVGASRVARCIYSVSQ